MSNKECDKVSGGYGWQVSICKEVNIFIEFEVLKAMKIYTVR
jgi:hypothetical protein